MPKLWKYKEARKIFLDVPQTAAPELIWSEPDEEALVRFLCHDRHIKYALIKALFCFHITRFCVSFRDDYELYSSGFIFREKRVRHRMEKFRQMQESMREEQEKERAAGYSRQTRIEDFFRVTRKRGQVIKKKKDNLFYKNNPKAY